MRVSFLALIALAGIVGPAQVALAQYYRQAPMPGYSPYPMNGAPAQYAMPFAPMQANGPRYAPPPTPVAMPVASQFATPQSPPEPVTRTASVTQDSSYETAASHEMAEAAGCHSCRSGSCDHCCSYKCDCGRCVHRTGFFGEYLNLQTRGIDTAYAVPQDGIGGLGTVPIGRVGTTNFDNHSGFRAGFTVAIDCCSSITATTTWFENDVEDEVTSDIVIQPLVAYPGTFNVGFTAQFASAQHHVEFQLVDVDYKAIWKSGTNYYINYLLGVRYAHLEQNFSALFPFAPPNGSTFVETAIDMDGGGIRFGIDGERQLCPCHGLGVYGKFVGSLLASQQRASYLQANQFNGIEATTDIKDSRVVPIVEAEIGVSWVSSSGIVRFSGGYYFATWANMISTPEYIDAVQNQNYVDVAQDARDTITFDGLVARMEVNL